MSPDLESDLREKTKDDKDREMDLKVKKTNKIALQAIQKEMDLEKMLEQEEKDKEKDEEEELMLKMRQEKSKEVHIYYLIKRTAS